MSVNLGKREFVELVTRRRAAGGAGGSGRRLVVPLGIRLLSDQLTPVLAYRRMVVEDERTAPSFLLESVEGGDRQGRYSMLGAHPTMEVVARGQRVKITLRGGGAGPRVVEREERNPLRAPQALSSGLELVMPEGAARRRLPGCFLGGWVGYAAYDTVRYGEPEKLGFASAPPDDRGLPEMHFGFYSEVVAFDHADKLVHVVRLADVGERDDPGAVYDDAVLRLGLTAEALQRHSRPLRAGELPGEAPADRSKVRSNMTAAQHAAMVEKAKEYIRAGDIFQVVLGQRFERESAADPFDVYRALRTVNPSPYMVYLQAEGCILVASSPEILCRVRAEERGGVRRLVVTNRPLAGTRRRGATAEEDAALERELLADEKERAEHIMLVDLGRNDVGVVARPGTVSLDAVMEVERYSHVMHISSTVTGELRDGVDCWDALAATLPVGTISGAPKIRAMQIIDELEPVRRGPYGGGFGCVGLDGQMDIALALRTMVVPTALHAAGRWTYHLQASGGIVFDSSAEAEHQETVNKAAALVRAIDVAEGAFGV
ncbi:MAG: chorismate-binding protein [Phycisphaerales bacterium]|nr:chorismate-binding protein [Phycisphaerales bacterium]